MAIIANEICIQIVPFVDRHNHKVAITFAGDVDWNERISKLIIEIIHWCDWRISWRGILRRPVVGIEDVDVVFARSRGRRQIVAAKWRERKS